MHFTSTRRHCFCDLRLARDKALECMLEDDSSHVLQVLQVDIASELSGIRKDASSLALAVDAIMKARASDVQGVLQKCEEASLGMTRGGASDWKQGIKDENDLAEVSAVASKTLEKVDGASLGQQLEACCQARISALCFFRGKIYKAKPEVK